MSRQWDYKIPHSFEESIESLMNGSRKKVVVDKQKVSDRDKGLLHKLAKETGLFNVKTLIVIEKNGKSKHIVKKFKRSAFLIGFNAISFTYLTILMGLVTFI
jgi:hypothetical protein